MERAFSPLFLLMDANPGFAPGWYKNTLSALYMFG